MQTAVASHTVWLLAIGALLDALLGLGVGILLGSRRGSDVCCVVLVSHEVPGMGLHRAMFLVAVVNVVCGRTILSSVIAASGHDCKGLEPKNYNSNRERRQGEPRGLGDEGRWRRNAFMYNGMR